MSADSEVLTLKEICELLRVHQTTVYRLAKRGEIPHFRIGSGWRFRKDDIIKWMGTKNRVTGEER